MGVRVLIAKPGLDGHDKGAKVLSAVLRDGGCEVIYTGLHQTPQTIARAALQEDVDVIGLSLLSGVHLGLTEAVIAELQRVGLSDRRVVVGGNIPDGDIPLLHDMGVARVFPGGTPYDDIVAWFNSDAARRSSTVG